MLEYKCVPGKCDLGSIVLVPLRDVYVIGIVCSLYEENTIPLCSIKNISKVLVQGWLSQQCMSLHAWIATTTRTSLTQVYKDFTIAAVYDITMHKSYSSDFYPFISHIHNKKDYFRLSNKHYNTCKEQYKSDQYETGDIVPVFQSIKNIKSLNTEQKRAVESVISTNGYKRFLLYGITGSGKTAVYYHIAKKILDTKGGTVVFMVPEIQMVDEFFKYFHNLMGDIAVPIHSKVNKRGLFDFVIHSSNFDLAFVICTRKGLCCNLKNVKLIVVDEEHDSSYHNEQYDTRCIADKYAQLFDVPIVFGSATPSVTTMHDADTILPIRSKASGHHNSKLILIDMRAQKSCYGLSKPLLDSIKTTVSSKKKVILYLNKVGYASMLRCAHCTWSMQCTQCSTHCRVITSYNDQYQGEEAYMVCMTCRKTQRYKTTCPICGMDTTIQGLGTEQLVDIVTKLFPDYKVVRLDSFNDEFKDIVGSIDCSDINIIIGTTLVSKGYDFKTVGMVAILDLDRELLHEVNPFTLEHTVQEIYQISGRTGRHAPGIIMLQTHMLNRSSIFNVLGLDYTQAYEHMLCRREKLLMPPFSHVNILQIRHKDKKRIAIIASNISKEAYTLSMSYNDITSSNAKPCMMFQCAGVYRYYILIRANKKAILDRYMNTLLPSLSYYNDKKRKTVLVHVDPITLT